MGAQSMLYDQGENVGHVLVGGALVLRPFVRSGGALAVTLCSADAADLERRVAALCQEPAPVRPGQLVRGEHRLTTPAVSNSYSAWAAAQPHGGDIDSGRRPERVDQGRAQLDGLARAEMSRAGDGDYSAALDRVLEAAASGVVTLSAEAAQGTGLEQPPGPGWRDRQDVQPVDPAQDPRFQDAAAYCSSRRPDAPADAPTGEGVGRRSELLERRAAAVWKLSAACNETLEQTLARLEREG